MDHLDQVKIQAKDFREYQKITPEICEKSIKISQKLKGKKIIHINSTQLGGGVSELLKNQLPLERSLGINSSWYIIKAPENFFKITKKIHNLLQGEPGFLSAAEKYFYLEWLYQKIAVSFKELLAKEKPDIVVIHDPQPLPLIDYFGKKTLSILRLHIDLSQPNQHILEFLQPLIEKYMMIILSHPSYRPDWLNKEKSKIIMPAIDPFTEKNKEMSHIEAERIISNYGVKINQPIISQVSRFDPWKDPLGVLKAYYLAKKDFPKLQLILAGLSQACDDPQALKIFKEVKKQSGQDPDIHIFFKPSDLRGITNDSFINSVYTVSSVVMQKSIKEGFGLTVTEAMWKKKPVIGGQTKGISLQIKDNQNGFLVSSPEEAAEKLIQLLKNPNLIKKMGQAAHQSVKNNFLISRFVLDNLEAYQFLTS